MKTKVQKLFKLLSLIELVQCTRWEMIMKIVDCINTSDIEVIEKTWYDMFKINNIQMYPLDLTNIKTWSTYDECILITFEIKSNKLYCTCVIWDGDNYNGNRTNKRFKTELILPDEFILNIEKDIEYSFERHLENQYDDYLEKQKEIWVNNLRDEILK